MSRTEKVIAALMIALCLGCASSQIKYDYGLGKVKAQGEETEVDGLDYEDDFIAITWAPTPKRLLFQLRNKTDEPIEIIWDKASFVGPRGSAQKVMHSGVRYMKRNESQPPTTVPSNAKIEDAIVPTNNVHFETGEYGGWEVDPYLPNEPAGTQTFRVILPIKHDDETERYSFHFSASQIAEE